MYTKALHDHVLEDIKKAAAKNPSDIRVYQKKREIKELGVSEIAVETAKYPTKHLIVTGGEPLLQRNRLALLARVLLNKGWFIEIETNGTLEPGPLSGLAHFNVSPKLKNSGNELGIRENPAAIRSFLKEKGVSFKFVVDRPQDLDEIFNFVSKYRIPKENIALMPQATIKRALQAKAVWLKGLSKKHGLRFSTRLQVALFNGRRGF